ncbi:uncharacterized protein LOC126265086 [Aethina tumida]|uniref:uncharacterized protein LOC126265086 n=1 Tax=Aethina tumida TaxID=116153 RepID=UPI0021487240|nr:uncharacterized protein LOC126265086 [Aethina tumida]
MVDFVGPKFQKAILICVMLLTMEVHTHTILPENSETEWEYDDMLNNLHKIQHRRQDDSDLEADFVKKSANYPESKTRKIQFFDAIQPHTCSCGMEFRLLDLGPTYFPRYVPTGVCNRNTCGPMKECVARQYKIRILKEKDANTDTPNEIFIPKSLSEYWTVEFVTVTVSCECHFQI